ncbi:MAG TPA: class I SAM-dependent methyltransferase [Candidatus Hydrogenedentes bacterium]|nr:class I SAM-dependent methyltransferase [Candidatus Hydrogenedentota bacterium]HOL76548.1 class I SAM-dependent methyltransferase [Candidatus Hydrogenedentota bacterium]HPO85212.1 class I SAM-dependent methyltransferase [Candidatus Hydrogenedentota bacterium]
MNRIYDNPQYYEIAFSFRDIPAEIDGLENMMRQYSKIPVKTVLEVACGSAPHLPELARRGYFYVGLDHNETMLSYARQRADSCHAKATFVCGDLTDFVSPCQADLAVIFLGSLYVVDNEGMKKHFDAIARALRPGGLYVLDWCVDFIPATDLCETWTEHRNGVRVTTTYHAVSVNRAAQTYRETVTLEVNDGGEEFVLQETAIKRAIYPQEFLLFVGARRDFEFVGWWNAWDLNQPLGTTESYFRPIVVIRRS